MKPWKSGNISGSAAGLTALQWGHGDEAVEEADALGLSRTQAQLQWGHGDEAVEEAASSQYRDGGATASMGPRR